MITPQGIKAKLAEAKKKQSDTYLSDDTGQRHGWRLQLRCMPSGSATWLFRYTHNGKRHSIPLGELSNSDIRSARIKAEQFASIYDDFPDVIGKLKDDEQAKQAGILAEQATAKAAESSRQQREKYTLSALMTMYSEHLLKQGKKKSAGDVVSISKHLESIKDKPAAEVSKRDLVTVQRKLLEVGKGRTANKLRSFVAAAFSLVLKADTDATAPAEALDFATEGGIETNPAALLAVAKGYNRVRDRVLTNIELTQLLKHAETAGAVGLAVRATVLLGGQRMAQLLRATIHDVQDGFLTLRDPKGKRDKPRLHPIPLEGIADTVIAEAIEKAKILKTDWLFTSSGKVPLSPCTVSIYVSEVSAQLIESEKSTSPFTLADLRRTVETRLAGLGISSDHRAQLQSHGLSGIQNRHYDRHEYEQEKRNALATLHRLTESLKCAELTA